MKEFFVYILTNKNKTVIYIGVTNDIERRVTEHQDGRGSNFTKKYKIKYLIYFETFADIAQAINREKQLKKWSRIKKEALIETKNPNWDFLEVDYI